MSTQQAFASPRDLEEFGIARKAIQAIPLAQRKRAIKAASGVLAPYLRKRAALPLTPRLDPDDFDTSGMAGGGAVAFDNGPAIHARDVLVTFAVPAQFGAVGDSNITYTVDLDNGAWGSIPAPALAFPISGVIAIDGYTFRLSGGINDNDFFSYSTRVDSGASAATCSVTAYMLLGSRGIDPTTLATLKVQNDAAIAWAKDVGNGDGFLEHDADATPDLDEGGPYGDGQTSPWAFMDVVYP